MSVQAKTDRQLSHMTSTSTSTRYVLQCIVMGVHPCCLKTRLLKKRQMRGCDETLNFGLLWLHSIIKAPPMHPLRSPRCSLPVGMRCTGAGTVDSRTFEDQRFQRESLESQNAGLSRPHNASHKFEAPLGLARFVSK